MAIPITRKSEKYENRDSVAVPPELNFTLLTRTEIGKIRLYDWSSTEIQSQLPTEILLITVNDHEFYACYSYMKHVQRSWHDKLGMVDFGKFGDGVRVALMKCTQGAAAAQITVKNAGSEILPKVVILVGICASMKPAEAKLGDVVISAKLATYADRKLRPDGTVEYRGAKVKVSRNMVHLILHAADGWEAPLRDQSSLNVEVHWNAAMLSGPELIDNVERCQEFLNHFPDVLAVEMEGAGT
jgi:adenosylhomocysteine nucleosidase